MPEQADVLSEELAYFEEQKEQFLRHHEGQFVLIKGRDLIGTYTTLQEAYTVGVQRFGNVPMLIKQVLREEPRHQAPALMHGLIGAHT